MPGGSGWGVGEELVGRPVGGGRGWGSGRGCAGPLLGTPLGLAHGSDRGRGTEAVETSCSLSTPASSACTQASPARRGGPSGLTIS